MVTTGLKSEIVKCLDEKETFVLQGGAGSGKTESLKQTLEYLSLNQPNAKVACFTHTNAAVDELKSRVSVEYRISTIHSFFNDFIKKYKKNIHGIIEKIFLLEEITREIKAPEVDDREYNASEHKRYKKLYTQYDKKLFGLKKEFSLKVTGKREYDSDPDRYNSELNEKITALNKHIQSIIQEDDYNKIKYNETKFDNLKDLSFGHDSLLIISFLLFKKYPRISKLLKDSLDYIFIDEYQDSNKDIIEIFIQFFSSDKNKCIGLYGDSMQSIYDDGIGELNHYIKSGKIKLIEKKDNFRCSEQVINFISKIRDDGLLQKVAYKNDEKTLEERQGSVQFYYSYNNKDPKENKDEYISFIDKKIGLIDPENIFTCLKLNNKPIARDAGFLNLYNIFNDRYLETNNELEKYLNRLQFDEIFKLCDEYKPYSKENRHNYNSVIQRLKKNGFEFKQLSNKKDIKDSIEEIINSDDTAINTIERAFSLNLLKKSNSFISYIEYKNAYFEKIKIDDQYQSFKKLHIDSTKKPKDVKKDLDIEDNEYKGLLSIFKREQFYIDFFSEKIKFTEIINYFKYVNEYTTFMTMHKTKGLGIDNVLVVLDSYFWNEYNFYSIFDSSDNNNVRRYNSLKLFYVACSRAKQNLKCFIVLNNQNERNKIKSFFGKTAIFSEI